jgi:hypothetical protein
VRKEQENVRVCHVCALWVGVGALGAWVQQKEGKEATRVKGDRDDEAGEAEFG